MGEAVQIELENANDLVLLQRGISENSEVRRVRIQAVADASAMMLALPADIVAELGLSEVGSVSARHAEGDSEPLPVAGPLNIRIGESSMVTDCVVVPHGADAVVGQIVTRTLDLLAGRTSLKLNPRLESPDRPQVRL